MLIQCITFQSNSPHVWANPYKINFQHFPCDLRKWIPTLCILSNNKKVTGVWNSEVRAHPISSVKYNLYFQGSEIQLFIFSQLWNTAFINSALYWISIFLYFITLYIINSYINSDLCLFIVPLWENLSPICLHLWTATWTFDMNFLDV